MVERLVLPVCGRRTEPSLDAPQVQGFGFPGSALPSVTPYMSRFALSEEDAWNLVEAAESELAEFEDSGWVASWDPAGLDPENFAPLAPGPLRVHLADAYMLPEDSAVGGARGPPSPHRD